MEVLQAIVYTTRYIFKNGNYDLYYLVALVLMVALFIKQDYKKYVKFIVFLIVFLLFIEVCSWSFSGIQHDFKDPVWFIFKIMLCVGLTLGVKEYFGKIDLRKILYYVVTIQFIETLMALFMVNEVWWKLNDVSNGFYDTRLQLLYMEPSELSMCSALMLILVVYLIEKEGFYYSYIPCVLILIADMYLSAGMCGILSISVAVGGVIFYQAVIWAVRDKRYYGLIVFAILAILAVSLIYGTNFPMMQRTRLILSGELGADSSTTWRLLMPLRAIGPILRDTHLTGLGFGNFNTPQAWDWMLEHVGWPNWFPNSFLYFIAEGGILAGIGVMSGIAYLAYKAFRTQKLAVIALFIFIVVYQVPGGYFTNPINWICYGVILYYGSCQNDIKTNVGK